MNNKSRSFYGKSQFKSFVIPGFTRIFANVVLES